MREIIPGALWIGNAREARDMRSLCEVGVMAIVDLAIEEPPIAALREMISLRIPLIDGSENPPAQLQLAIHSVEQLLRKHVPTLVACSMGLSRSPLIAAAALSRLNQSSIAQELNAIASIGPVDPLPGLMNRLKCLS